MQIFEKTTDTQGMHNGYGFMRFDVAQTAKLLHRLVHTVVPFDSAKIPKSHRVGAKVARRLIHAEQDRQVLEDAVKSEFTTVFVGGLDPDVTRDELRARFKQYGKITSISIPRDPESGSGKGFGFVKFLEHADALEAIKGANGTVLKGQLLKVLKKAIGSGTKKGKVDKPDHFDGSVDKFDKFIGEVQLIFESNPDFYDDPTRGDYNKIVYALFFLKDGCAAK